LPNALNISEHQYAAPVTEPIFELMRPNGQTKTVFFTGKGGVGKTTISCAAAFQLAAQGFKTLLLTTDPASHIGEVLEQRIGDRIQPVEGVPNLFATIIDQEKALEQYKQRILDDAQAKYSEDMLVAIREELESPCTEEMAAFDKFMHYVESDTFDVIVFDTAPTGHTLRLLQLPFDYSDQVSLMVTTSAQSTAVKSETQQRFDRIIARLKDPRQSAFAFVVYPESTPVVEAYRAMLDLKEAGIPTQFVIANQVLAPEYCVNAYFTRRRLMQTKYLQDIKNRFLMPMAVMPLLETEIRGLAMVKQAAEQLFRTEPIIH
jgi:arsenite-transporting ATPase